MNRAMALTAAAVSVSAIAGLSSLTLKQVRINLLARSAQVALLKTRKECNTTARLLGVESGGIKPGPAADIQLRRALAGLARFDGGDFTENPVRRFLGQSPGQAHWLHLATQDSPDPFTCPPPPETTADAAADVSIIYKARGTVFETLRLYASSDVGRIRIDVDGDPHGASILYDRAAKRGVYLPPTGTQRSFSVDRSNRLPFLLEYLDDIPLKRAGSDIVAGQRCTKWAYRKRDDRATFCAMGDGILLKILATDRRGTTNISAVSVIRGPLPESVFCAVADRTREAASFRRPSCASWSIYALPKKLPDPAMAIEQRWQLLEVPKSDLQSLLNPNLGAWLLRRASAAQAAAVEDLHLYDVGVLCDRDE